MKADPPVLETQGLDSGYGGKTIVKNISLQALRGQTLCLLGPNGSGKSTVLRTLAGLLEPVHGAVYVCGGRIERMKPVDKAKTLAVVLTESLSIPMTSVFEITAMGRTPHTGFFGKLSGEDIRIVNEALETAGAASLAGREYYSLSDGEKQKVMIARALAQQPRLIILDEPTSHLDIRHKIEVMRILARLSRERSLTVILAMHDIDIALKACEHVLLIKDGKISDAGKPEDLMDETALNRLYGITDAFYDALLGGTELRNDLPPRAFIVGGAGTGTPLYRTVSRMGLGIATGILHRNDIDCRIALDMSLTVVAEDSFMPIREDKSLQAWRLMQDTGLVVDSGFPAGDFNSENMSLLRRAASSGLRCISLRPIEHLQALYGDAARNVERVESSGGVSNALLSLIQNP
ncbi:MAG: ABC transporter ATP-binding protein [Spirochaetaceae bacterium]|jgi:iron complex transport system ATP-binding protein|nr:ABC transporter ATP-binding protein [Spirochaetaceae bacterium]